MGTICKRVSATQCKSFLHVKRLFAVTLPPSGAQSPEDQGGIGSPSGSAAVGPLSGRQSHPAEEEEEEVIKQLEMLRADGWR